ncbi:OLC1v1028153C1 [Oldenlandia corymbosa var. corymbosa]|uniref:OLC1v1028153C1 n=1 Tax=Oldenlandia corymbosa var. corymbosa TaxID=529605 RepID=A0AAV1CB21_OLDCO|nr:OLC1v1028153C1 [Oldenlandia corymbosa var. corymbosa]
MMKISPLFIISSSVLFVALFSATPTSAHFFPNITSIPKSLIPNTTAWDRFNKLAGCEFGQKLDGLSKLKQYFQRFGYINQSFLNFTDDFDDSLESAIKIYQQNFNLNATGQLDGPTLQHITRPRCGNPDIVNGTSSMNSGKAAGNTTSPNIHTVAHYSFFPGRPRWPRGKTELTYAFLPANQVEDVVRTVFANAFGRWSEVTPLNFTETSSYNAADIKIGIYSGDHNDGEPFDGVLGTLAHAFSPPSGLLHLDGDENWVIDGDFLNAPSLASAVDLESVVVHEIGHLLGLGHSSVEESIMYPSIASVTRKVELTPDDIQGIQVLYGSNPNSDGPQPTLTPSNEKDSGGSHGLTASWVLLTAGLLLLLPMIL